jgi:flagellar export protein FliJ
VAQFSLSWWLNLLYLIQLKKSKIEKESEIEKKRKELLNKIKERKSLEILKEKQHLAYLKEVNKEEQNFIDEINTSRYGRGKSGSVLL